MMPIPENFNTVLLLTLNYNVECVQSSSVISLMFAKIRDKHAMLEIELHSEKTPTFFSAHSMRTPSAVKGLSALQRQESQEVSQLLNTSTPSMCA